MPLYEYVCQACQHPFEALVYDGEATECPQCQSRDLDRLLSMPGLPQVKGGGDFGPCGDPSLPPCGAAGCRRGGQ